MEWCLDTHEVSGHVLDSIGADESAAATRLNLGEERDDKQTLLGRVEEVNEKVAVYVPATELVARNVSAFAFRGAEIDYQSIIPSSIP